MIERVISKSKDCLYECLCICVREREIVKSLFKLVKSFCLINPFQISFVPVSVLQLMRRLLEKPVVSSWWEGELVSLRLAWGG